MAARIGTVSRIGQILRSSGLLIGSMRILRRSANRLLDVLSTMVWRRQLAHCGAGTRIQYGVLIEYPHLVSVGRDCLIQRGARINCELGSGRLVLSDRVQINSDVHLDHTGGLSIGSDSLVSEGVVIYSHSHGSDPRSAPDPIEKQIGDHVWIGSRAVILERCKRVGAGSLVGAGAVVAKDIPLESIAYGNPCIIKPKVTK